MAWLGGVPPTYEMHKMSLHFPQGFFYSDPIEYQNTLVLKQLSSLQSEDLHTLSLILQDILGLYHLGSQAPSSLEARHHPPTILPQGPGRPKKRLRKIKLSLFLLSVRKVELLAQIIRQTQHHALLLLVQ
jgi:hypothetical protein